MVSSRDKAPDFSLGADHPINNEHLKEFKVRAAIQHAVNKAVISQGVFHGFEPPADTLYARSIPYCDIDLKPFAYDMKLAAKLLEEAGYTRDGERSPLMKNGKPLVLGLLYNSNSVSEKTIPFLIYQFKSWPST